MANTAIGESVQYGTTTITGQATALLGNKYGDIFNIQQATFLLSSTSIADSGHGQRKVVRQNRVLPHAGYTIETITTFDDGNVLAKRGTSQQVELRWERREDIGVGVFGEVHREENCESDKVKSRAVKILRRRQLERMKIDYKKELDALIQLSQPEYVHRFIEFYSWYENENNIYLAMEYIPCGDLESYIHAGLKEADVRQIIYQVLDGIRVMHRLDLIHRDIKPANIFVVQQVPVWWVKIGDFSICKSTTTRQTSLHTQVGTQGYQAPEIVGLVATEKSNQYNSKCDIWSFGCLVYEMLTGQLPFADVGALTRFCNDGMPFPSMPLKKVAVSRLIAEFAWTMLQTDPQTRPTAEEAAFLLSWRCEADSVQDGQHLYFKDCVGRDWKFPWENCSTWADMKFMIRLALSYIEHVQRQVLQEEYDLSNVDGDIINAENWVLSVRSGMRILMRLRPEKSSDHVSQAETALLGNADAEKTEERPLHQDPDTTEAAELPSSSKVRTTSDKFKESTAPNTPQVSTATDAHDEDRLVVPTIDGKLLGLSFSDNVDAAVSQSDTKDTYQNPVVETTAIEVGDHTPPVPTQEDSPASPNLPTPAMEVPPATSSSGDTYKTRAISNSFSSSVNELDDSTKISKRVESNGVSSSVNDTDRATLLGTPAKEEFLYLTNCLGSVQIFPWQKCKHWDDMFHHIHCQFIANSSIEPWVRRGHFDLVDKESRKLVSPRYWEVSVSPGSTILMAAWHTLRYASENTEEGTMITRTRDRRVPRIYSASETSGSSVRADRYVGDLDLWAAATGSRLSDFHTNPFTLNPFMNAPLKFTDCFGKYHEIPWSSYRSWLTMKAYIDFVCAPIDDYFRGDHIRQCHYDLYSRELKGTISEERWEVLVSPGIAVDMLLWPRCEHVLRVLSRRNLQTLSKLAEEANPEQETQNTSLEVLSEIEDSSGADTSDLTSDEVSILAERNDRAVQTSRIQWSRADIVAWLKTADAGEPRSTSPKTAKRPRRVRFSQRLLEIP